MEENTNFEVLLKIIILGESNVGKTSLLTRYIDNKFDKNIKATIGIDTRYRIIKKSNKKIKVNFHDTAGQERFNSLVSTIYKGAEGVILVYDITNKQSFEKVKKWYEKVLQNCSKNIKICLLGNKNDLEENKRNVSFEEVKNFAETEGIFFRECSALSDFENKIGDSVDKLIDNVLVHKLEQEREIEEIAFTRQKAKTLVLKMPKVKEKKKCC